jgi:hypothetical protein
MRAEDPRLKPYTKKNSGCRAIRRELAVVRGTWQGNHRQTRGGGMAVQCCVQFAPADSG